MLGSESVNKRKNAGKKLEADVKKLEEEMSSNLYNIDDKKLDILVQKKNEFIEMRDDNIEGVMLPS